MLTPLKEEKSDWQDLARQRAMKIKDSPVQGGKIEAERIFQGEAKFPVPEKKENLTDSRVVFGLK